MSEVEKTENIAYLSDGVYVEYTGYSFILRANDHRDGYCTDTIHLEPFAIEDLNRFVKRMRGKNETGN